MTTVSLLEHQQHHDHLLPEDTSEQDESRQAAITAKLPEVIEGLNIGVTYCVQGENISLKSIYERYRCDETDEEHYEELFAAIASEDEKAQIRALKLLTESYQTFVTTAAEKVATWLVDQEAAENGVIKPIYLPQISPPNFAARAINSLIINPCNGR